MAAIAASRSRRGRRLSLHSCAVAGWLLSLLNPSARLNPVPPAMISKAGAMAKSHADTPYHRRPMRLWKQRSPRPVSFEAFGVQVEVTLGEEELKSAVDDILPPESEPCDVSDSAGKFGLRQTEPGGYEVTVGEASWLRHGTLEVALGMLDAQIRLFKRQTRGVGSSCTPARSLSAMRRW